MNQILIFFSSRRTGKKRERIGRVEKKGAGIDRG